MNSVIGEPLAAIPGLKWANRFARLGTDFYTDRLPSPLPAPYWVSRNQALARELGLDHAWFESQEALALFTGNQLVSRHEEIDVDNGGWNITKSPCQSRKEPNCKKLQAKARTQRPKLSMP